jgi:MerR family mercuric resistance operon transcriptional regulator
MDSGAPLAIGTLAKRTGTNVETIRYYERVGLWAVPARSAGGYRLYGKGHLKRLNFMRRARVLGFSIDQVRTLLGLADERNVHARRYGSLPKRTWRTFAARSPISGRWSES